LSKRCVLVLILFLLLFTTSQSVSLEASSPENDGPTEDSPAAALQVNMSSPQDLTSTANLTGVNTTAANLKYIWSISGIEKDQITMALNQEGNDLFGKAKYEPENGQPWNGVVAGSVSENRVHLAIAAIKGKEKISIVLDGVLADGAISGEFFQVSEGRISGSGEFNALWINPDLSSYVPAKVTEQEPEMHVPAINVSSPSAVNQTDLQSSQPKSRFHDIHLDADRIQTGVGDISQIPIGMG
jgi:hypothetical protein